VTSPATVFTAVESAARQRGVGILKSEVVGLIPERAVLDAGAASLRLSDPESHLLEPKIRAAEGPTLDGWLDDLAGGAPVPGGGSAAALAGALAAALVRHQTPLAMARGAARLLALAQEIGTIGNRNARSDARVGEALARAALSGAVENVRVNVGSLSEPGLGKSLLEEAEGLVRQVGQT